MNGNNMPPLAEIFLLLPEHKRIIQKESKCIGVPQEAANLRRVSILLGIGLMIYLIFIMLLLAMNPNGQLSDLIVGLIPAIIIAIGFSIVYKRYRCISKLETMGILLAGRVIAVKGDNAVTSKGIKTALRLRYEFISPQGQRFEREEAQLRENLQEMPALGTSVAVIYASDDCFRVL